MSENKCPNLCCGNMQRIAELEAQETEWAQKIADQALQIGGLEMDLDIAAEQHATLALLRAENKSLREQLAELQARRPVVVGYVSDGDRITLQALIPANFDSAEPSVWFQQDEYYKHPIYIDPQPQEVKV